MTREEALVQLRLGPGINEDVSEEYDEAVDMAIEALEQQPNKCEYCHEDSDGYIKPLEKNCHAYIEFGMHGWVIELKAKGWRGKAPINFCPMCGRRLTDGRFN